MVVLSALLLTVAPFARAQSAAPRSGDAQFTVLQRGMPIGTATSTVVRTPDGWTIGGATRIDAPIDVTINRIEVAYSAQWTPSNATVDIASHGEGVVVHGGGFGALTPARIDIVRGGRQVTFVTTSVSRDVVILPNFAYAAYEALAARLENAAAGTRLPVYVMPQREIAVRVDAGEVARLPKGAGQLATRHVRLTFLDPTGDVAADLWVDGGRMARFDLPSQGLSVVRSDLASR